MTDKQLIEGLQNEDPKAVKYLYAEYLQFTINYILKNGGNEEDARDIFQDTILAVIANIRKNKYENKGKFSAYFITIVKNKWRDKLDEIGKVKPMPPDRGQDDPHFEFKKFSLDRYLEQALNKLGEPCKSLLIAAIVFKKRMEQIATEFNYSNARVASNKKLTCLVKLRGLVDPDTLMNLI